MLSSLKQSCIKAGGLLKSTSQERPKDNLGKKMYTGAVLHFLMQVLTPEKRILQGLRYCTIKVLSLETWFLWRILRVLLSKRQIIYSRYIYLFFFFF